MSDDDHGAFRAEEAGSGAAVVLRPGRDGLVIERDGGCRLIAWSAICSVQLLRPPAGRATVPAARVRTGDRALLDFADAFAPGASELPAALDADAPPLLRAERCRLLAAVIVAAAGLAPRTPAEFARGPRGVPVPPLASRPRAFPRWTAPALFLLSAAALVFLAGASPAAAFAILLVFLAHEGGHALALRAVGAGVRGFLFFPLLGAGTVPDHPFAARWDEARVALAGPATGLPAAALLALALAAVQGSRVGGGGAVVVGIVAAIGVNAANLLPLLPMDGGTILASLAAGIPATGRGVVAFLPIAGAAVAAVALVPRTGALVVVAAFLGLSVALTRTQLRRDGLRAWTEALPCGTGAVRASLRDVTFALTGAAREDADGGLPPAPMTRRQTALVVALYAAEVLALAGAAALFVVAFPQSLDELRGAR